MPRTFRHSLLVALLLGFVPASVLNNFAAPLPPAAPKPLPRTRSTSAWEATMPWPRSPTTFSAAWPLTPKRAASSSA